MRGFWPALAAVAAADALIVRSRAGALDVLGAEAPGGEPGPERGDGAYRLVTAAGVVVDGPTVALARAHAAGGGLDALDLIPGNLPADRLLDLLHLVDPATYRDDPLVTGYGAHAAVLVSEGLARRAGVERFSGLDADEMARLMVELKRYAPRSTSLVLAPSFRLARGQAGTRAAHLEAAIGRQSTLSGLVVELLMASGARHRRGWALTAALLRAAQPVLALAGTAARPMDMRTAVPRRLVSPLVDLPRAVLGAAEPAPEPDTSRDRARQEYGEMLADGVDALFGPRRPDCPLCGSDDLRVRRRKPDLLQGKPGVFTLEECGGCGHIFQNPCLNARGLDFYYRDFYEPMLDSRMNFFFSSFKHIYRARAEMLREVSAPRRWLDVGTSEAHFCLAARSTWPDTSFDGLDMGATIHEAERRGWVDNGHRGVFHELAGKFAGEYDVVSMFHYLEHTVDPARDIDAAATALAPGGHLLIEVPDPSSRLTRVLGPYWPLWGQPQHLHLFTAENLSFVLESRGFTVVAVVREPAHIPVADFAGAPLQLVAEVAPPVDVPWKPPPTARARATRAAAVALGAPLTATGVAADLALAPLSGLLGTSNAYRILARRD
jgi:SAM-dependent methyltransferase